jgi:hypothetical protein
MIPSLPDQFHTISELLSALHYSDRFGVLRNTYGELGFAIVVSVL